MRNVLTQETVQDIDWRFALGTSENPKNASVSIYKTIHRCTKTLSGFYCVCAKKNWRRPVLRWRLMNLICNRMLNDAKRKGVATKTWNYLNTDHFKGYIRLTATLKCLALQCCILQINEIEYVKAIFVFWFLLWLTLFLNKSRCVERHFLCIMVFCF